MRDNRKDFVVKEIWEDGSETYYIAKEHEQDHAIHRAKERWDSMAHVYGQHGTTIIRPIAFELVGMRPEDLKRFWHPASSITSLVKRVYLLDEMEHYYEYA